MDLIARASPGLANTTINDDALFGPQLGHAFDFTMVFNNTILTILPSVVMITACFVYGFWYRKRSAVTSNRYLLWSKAICVFCLVVFEVVRSVLWSQVQDNSPETLAATSVAASVLSNTSSLALGIALCYDHFYALQSTSFLSVFLVVSVVTEISRTRSFFLREGMGQVAGLSVGCVVTKSILAILLELPKVLDAPEYKDKQLVPDDTVGFWGRILVWWANSIFFHGFRNHLTMDELGELEPKASSTALGEKFEPIWGNADKTSKYALIKACTQAHGWLVVGTLVPNACLTVLNYLAVFAMQDTLDVLKRPDSPRSTRIGLICANVLIYAALAVANSQYLYMTNQLSVRLRGTLSTEMIKKNARLAVRGAKRKALLTHIAADLDGIIAAIPMMYALSLAVPALAVGFYFLYTVVGNAFFLPILPILLSTVIGLFLGKTTQPATHKWNQSIQTRVTKTTNILAHMTGLKMMGLDSIIANFVQSLRLKEVADSMWARKLKVMLIAALPLNYWFTPTVVFVGGIYWTVWKSDGLDFVLPWVALGIINLIRVPMWYLLQSWTIIGGFVACFDRIQSFLLEEEWKDMRQVHDFAEDQASSLSTSSQEKKQEQQQGSTTLNGGWGSQCISLSTVNIAAEASDENILEDLDFSIPAGKLTLFVGSIGSGKTVLLKALIGEVPFSTGTIHVSSKYMAYCGQNPWLPNGTVQSAIVAHDDFNEARYNSVLAACALDTDIKALAGGSDFEIGPNGAKLSGGQRHRVALARAIYSMCPILVCDNVLSALDAKTARHVFGAIFGVDGMLKQQGRAAIFATHERAWLSSADQLIHLHERKATVYSGNKAVKNFMHSAGRTVGFKMGSMLAQSSEPEIAAPDKALEYARQDKEKAADKLDTSLYRYLFRTVPMWILVQSLCLVLFNGVMERGPELYVRVWIARDPTNTRLVLGMLGVSVLSIFTAAWNAWVWQICVVPKIAEQTHATFCNTIFKATLQYLTSTNNGLIIGRCSQDMTLLGQEMPWILFVALMATSVYITNVAFIVAGTNYTAATIPPLFVFLWLLQGFYLRTSRQLRLLELEAKSPLFNALNEIISGIEHARSYQWAHTMVRHSLVFLDSSQKAYYHMITIQRWLTLVLDILGIVMVAILVAIALLVVDSTSQAALGLSLINLAFFAIMNKQLVERWTMVETSLGAVKRLKMLEEDTPCERDSPEMHDPPATWPSQGRVEFKNVSATYGSPDSTPAPALEGVSATLQPGQKVIVKGRTGSGKSTLVLAILNLLNLDGQILIDGLDITKMPHEMLRSKITSLPQESIELPDTTQSNLVPSSMLSNDSSLSKETIEGVLKDVGLWDHIEAKGGLDTPFEDMHFSSGQRQMFNIARAILHHLQFNTKIVVMDEIASSLDYQTRESLERVMKVAFKDCTRVIVSHDMSDTMDCDLVLTLSNGRLVDTDLVEEIGEQLASLFNQ